MMNISSKIVTEIRHPFMASPLDYRDVLEPVSSEEAGVDGCVDALHDAPPIALSPTPEEVDGMLAETRAQAIRETEERMRKELEEKLAQARGTFLRKLEEFAESRTDYFAKVESEVIQLSLAIAAKILHRESAADPMLVAAMVRIELDKLQADSKVVLRVPVENESAWMTAMSQLPRGIQAEVVGDAHLAVGDCVLLAEAGSVDLGIKAQLKNVEQSFLDLLKKRPAK